jgi:putative peptide maturation dehydrogenase
MPRVRRSAYVFYFSHDYRFPDPARLLAGEVELRRTTQLTALSVLTGASATVSPSDIEYAQSLRADEWTEPPDGLTETALRLAAAGVLVSDEEHEPFRTLRERDELLRSSGWNAYAALYHFLTRRRDFDLRDGLEDRDAELPPITGAEIDDFIRRRGTPPPAFHAVEDPLAVEKLPPPTRREGLSDVLRRRRTTRAFDADVTLGREQLGTILYEVFGCHGYTSVRPGVDTVKRTSPSAGGLHPVEPYPLVRNVDGLAPGLYHYRSRDHALELVRQLDDLDEFAKRAVCGQTYFADAHVLFLLTARFARSHWKYRYHQRVYATTLLDAGHLSQTLYLLATELGLGAFVTAAINDAYVDEVLGLDGCTEGTLAIAGCGPAAATRSPFDPVFEPYDLPHAPSM